MRIRNPFLRFLAKAAFLSVWAAIMWGATGLMLWVNDADDGCPATWFHDSMHALVVFFRWMVIVIAGVMLFLPPPPGYRDGR